MTRFYTPNVGPHAGILCLRAPDGTVTPAPDIDTSKAAPPVALPPDKPAPQGPGSGIEVAGEPCPWINTRDNIGRMAKSLRDNGFARPEERAREAASAWAAGVRSGSIKVQR